MKTAGEYLDEMLSGQRITYFNYHRTWERDHEFSSAFVVRLFMAIKDIIIYKKLSDAPDKGFADGYAIVKALNPGYSTYASYWLQRPENRYPFEQLEKASLVKKHMRNSGPYGYGDDEQYWFTDLAYQLIDRAKTNDLIKLGVRNIVLDKTTKDIWHLDRYGEEI